MTQESQMNRRVVLQGGAATLGLAALSAPLVARADTGPLKVATYGGYFQDSFDKHIFPAFTEETGIEVESIASPTSDTWLVQLQQAARANRAPADVSMIAQVLRLMGERAKLWAPIPAEKIPNAKNLPDHFVHGYDDGTLSGLGAVAWFITLVTNTNSYAQAPSSWKAL